jgi:hypothetical protein
MEKPKPPDAAPRRLRIGLMPSHLRYLSAGHPLEVRFGDLIVELMLREEITGFCTVHFSQRRSVVLEWPASKQAENITTVQRYLKAGASFYRPSNLVIEPRTTLHIPEPLTDPERIVQGETYAMALWPTGKNPDKPSPLYPR